MSAITSHARLQRASLLWGGFFLFVHADPLQSAQSATVFDKTAWPDMLCHVNCRQPWTGAYNRLGEVTQHCISTLCSSLCYSGVITWPQPQKHLSTVLLGSSPSPFHKTIPNALLGATCFTETRFTKALVLGKPAILFRFWSAGAFHRGACAHFTAKLMLTHTERNWNTF